MRRGDGVVVVASVAVAAVMVAATVTSLRWKRTANFAKWRTPKVIPAPAPEVGKRGVSEGVLGAIGNTPMIRIGSLSDATGCEIYGKAEFLNPGGSVKDRVASKIVAEALQSGALRVGGVVTEGSAGSTAVSLAMVALAYGCKCHVVLPDDAAIEKTQILESMGATVERVRPVSITHKDHFVNVARRRALEAGAPDSGPESQLCALAKQDPQLEKRLDQHVKKCAHDADALQPLSDFASQTPGAEEFTNSVEKEIVACISAGLPDESDVEMSTLGAGQVDTDMETCRHNVSSGRLSTSDQGRGGYFADQFENLANFRAHYEGTGPEIWEQSRGKVDAFIAAAGTGGTIAGVSRYLKEQNPQVKCYIIDPPGSGLYNRVTRGVMYTRQEAEGKRMRNPFDTITEGIGINRITENFKQAQLDGAFRGTDKEAVEMARYLMRNDGLFVGSSSAMNCVGAVRVAQMLGPGHTIVTILCDGGARHLSKFQNAAYLAAAGLTPTATSLEFLQPRNST